MFACFPPTVLAKPLTRATLPGCDFTQSAAVLITVCAESSIAADHDWKNTTNFCGGWSAAYVLPETANRSRETSQRRRMPDSLRGGNRHFPAGWLTASQPQ